MPPNCIVCIIICNHIRFKTRAVEETVIIDICIVYMQTSR